MVCKKLESSLVALAFGELDEANAQYVREHAQSCSRCGRLLKEYELLYGLIGDGAEVPDSSLSADALREAILSRELQRSNGQWVKRGLALAGASLLGAFGVAVSLYWIFALSPQISQVPDSSSPHLAQASSAPKNPSHLGAGKEGDSAKENPSSAGAPKERAGSAPAGKAVSRLRAGQGPSLPSSGRGERGEKAQEKMGAGMENADLAVIFVDFGQPSSEGAKTAVELSGENALSFGS